VISWFPKFGFSNATCTAATPGVVLVGVGIKADIIKLTVVGLCTLNQVDP
jgi:hypothetical protein